MGKVRGRDRVGVVVSAEIHPQRTSAGDNDMPSEDDVPQDMPLDAFIEEMAECGYEWVKRIGHVNVHIFEHNVTHHVMPVPVERDVVRAPYVANARKKCRELRGGP